MKEKRLVGLDLVRVISVVLVFSLHFMLRSGYYNTAYYGIGMFFLTIFNWLTLTCIGLFMILTGFFGKKIKLDRNYFLRLLKIIISYLIISILCVCFRLFYLNEDVSFAQAILSILDFSADGYAWYVEMYIGLYLLIPFLNLVYDKTKNKKYLIIIFLFLTAIPSALRLVIPEWVGHDILPNRWLTLYPMTYYFIGRYLHENPLKISNKKKFGIMAISLFVESILCFTIYHGKTYPGVWFGFNDVGHLNIFTVIIATMIVSVGASLKINKLVWQKIICSISSVTFEMYLISWMVDNFIYETVSLSFDGFLNYFINYFVYVGLVFIISYIIALIINKISSFIWLKLKKVSNDFFINFEKCMR